MNLWRVIPACATVALTLALVGCDSHSDGAAPAPAAHHTSSRPAATPSTPSAPASKLTPPRLDPNEILAGQTGTRTGNAELPYKAGRKDYALIVAVRCQGNGKVKVRLDPVHASFPLTCGKTVDTTYNQLHVTGTEKAGTISVTASPSAKWAVTIGRGIPAQEEG